MNLPDPPYRVALVGAGRVGVAVCALLKERGHQIASVTSRSAESAEAAARRLDAVVGEPDDADVVLLGVPTSALLEVVATFRTTGPVIHFAGVLGVAGFPANVVALHPVQACPDVDTAIARLPGCAWGVTCADEMRDWANAFVEIVDGEPIEVAEEDRPLWHAAAVATSNGIAALMATGEAILDAIGVASPERVLGPIAAATVVNAREGGGGAATLTGPVVRAEADTVGKHVAALRSHPELLDAYLNIARVISTSARRSGRIDDEASARIEEMLRP